MLHVVHGLASCMYTQSETALGSALPGEYIELMKCICLPICPSFIKLFAECALEKATGIL